MPWKDVLLASVQYRSRQTTKDVLESGAHPNGPHPNTITPLQIAVQNNDRDSVQLLLKFDADVNILTSTQQMSALHFAAEKNVSVTIFKMLLSANADVSLKDSTGRTPLHVAAESLDFRKVCAMLQCPDPPVNAVNYKGETAMHTLLASSTKEEHIPAIKHVFKLMLLNGFNVRICDNAERTVFHVALQHVYNTRLLPILLDVIEHLEV